MYILCPESAKWCGVNLWSFLTDSFESPSFISNIIRNLVETNYTGDFKQYWRCYVIEKQLCASILVTIDMSRNHANLYAIVMNKTCTPIILEDNFDHAWQVVTNGILISCPCALFIA